MAQFRIKDILKEKGLTQKELAERMGKAPQYINNVVNGGRDASINTLEKIAESLNVPIAELFEKRPEPTFTCPHCGKEIHIKVE